MCTDISPLSVWIGLTESNSGYAFLGYVPLYYGFSTFDLRCVAHLVLRVEQTLRKCSLLKGVLVQRTCR
jgi:hypothetical protein